MTRVFVDADVILDAFLARKPFHEEALRFFSRLRAEGGGFTSPLIMANVHYVLTRIQNKHYALGRVRALRKSLSIAPITEEMVDAAIAGVPKDFEDGLEYQCAIHNGMELLVTRNARHFPAGPLEVCSPAEYLAASER